MKKTIRVVLWVIAILMTHPMVNAADAVPDYYYANYQFISDWDQIWNIFNSMKSRYDLWLPIEKSYFSDLHTHFTKTFPHLTSDYSATYDKCILLAENNDIDGLLWNTCYRSLSSAVQKINSSYTVKAVATATPSKWSAPLTVTFDARWSIDPSSETIPTDNFFRYYRDEKWVDRPMWRWNVINYEFKEAGNFIVHLVVRSSNVDMWVLDWTRDLTVNVAPKAANIVVYANTRKMSTSTQTKIWVTEWEKWVVFDGSATMPTWWRRIMSHKRTIQNATVWFSYTRQWDWAPWYINVPLKWNGEFKVTLTTKDNENNTVSETFILFMSDPVTIIKQTPERWNTSSTFTFDWSASYSITNRLNTYLWEIFDANGDKIPLSEQNKKMSKIFIKPWNYRVRLTVTDLAGQKNVEYKDIYVDSTTPTPQFTINATSKRANPSEFTLDASNSSDIDVLNWVDSLEYSRKFSTDKVSIISTENNNEKIVVQFDEVWKHTIKLTVTDEYGKIATISKVIDVKSVLRPEIEPIPWAITRWKEMNFRSYINTWMSIINYVWNYGDGSTTNSESAVNTLHIYNQRWVYTVTLTVYDKQWNSNTVTEKVFIWEIEYPIAAYRVQDSKWFYIQSSDTCREVNENGQSVTHYAYPVDRYSKFTINSSISVNTQWNSQGLSAVFQPEPMYGPSQSISRQTLSHSFSMTWCHYVDLTVKDSNVGKQDKVRIWFNVKNALPTIKNVTLSFPQYSDDSVIGFWTTNSNSKQFDCTWTSNLTIKVTAVGAADSDWSVSRIRFYYYDIEDADRILEYKESWSTTPYAYFVIPKIGWEYKFGVMVYDNDGWMIDSKEVLSSNPSVYFPPSCDSSDIPTVTLKVSSQNIQVWDTVTYTISSKISSNYEDFETDRTFYYDFTWDGTWDLVTKKSVATYTFTEPYEEWVVPRAAVEFRWKIWKRDGDRIFVKNWVRPVLLYNAYKNNVIFRDLSVGTIHQRQICFDTQQCDLWNTKYIRRHIVTSWVDMLTWWSSTVITENDSFLQKYPDYGSYNVSIYLKSKFWIEVQTWFVVKTTNNENNGRVAPGINIISIPEMTQTNSNMEVFLSKVMNSTLLMYISNETWETCYVDTDIATDSDWDGKTDNDLDVACNTLAKIVYEPNYESAIWRVYFTDEWNLVYKNFYVTFEWYILELDEEKLEIYNNLTILINGIKDLTTENTNLKRSLDVLRKNLNNKNMVSATIVTIQNQLDDWWIMIDENQHELINSIINNFSNADTVVAVWMNEYEKNKLEILAILPTSMKPEIEDLFNWFEDNITLYDLEQKYNELQNIWNTILKKWKQIWWIDDNDAVVVQWYFCGIFEYYGVSSYNSACSTDVNQPTIGTNYSESKSWRSIITEKNWMPWRLKIILIILVWGLLVMWWVIVFFSIKARLNSSSDEDEEW